MFERERCWLSAADADGSFHLRNHDDFFLTAGSGPSDPCEDVLLRGTTLSLLFLRVMRGSAVGTARCVLSTTVCSDSSEAGSPIGLQLYGLFGDVGEDDCTMRTVLVSGIGAVTDLYLWPPSTERP